MTKVKSRWIADLGGYPAAAIQNYLNLKIFSSA